ncbi:hypothetical protein [Novosphingobium pituita]|uniref:Uncharacterized protein n=1 Tax=Novosphingobium pituita TaxID=3056842 RepID=A0ABQ6P6H9_9SPHN|nr:hypothetical protein [Novosphingobium sp. IK01]GMM60690.1 hypothetical protein NUTIK01_14670 [Novosphingobium sp. IK01]
MRAVYRDGHDTMLVAWSKGGAADPQGGWADDCHAALLITGADGHVSRLSPQQAQARMKTMQLSGASEGQCPVAGRAPDPSGKPG